MPVTIGPADIAIRLGLTVLAGLAIGFDRSEQGKAAGLRTTLLVGLAATVAMIQVNLLLPTAGRASDSFVMNDLMRLPLGILTGVGFIGGGAILRRGDLVVGVTTASTLWLMTVIGLCFGGGQIVLGIAATVLGLVALTLLKAIEDRLRREHRFKLVLELDSAGPGEQDVRRRLAEAGLQIANARLVHDRSGVPTRRLAFEIHEFRRMNETVAPPVIAALANEAGVVKVTWQTQP